MPGLTTGYFVAMYLERTRYKDQYVREVRLPPSVRRPATCHTTNSIYNVDQMYDTAITHNILGI